MSRLYIKTDNPNYLASVVKLTNLRKHPNADKLQIALVNGYNVITGLNAKDGDIYIYFPLESKINLNYLSYSNSFAKSELNKDHSVRGFFGNAGRVKTTKLRGVFSEGYIVPVSSLVEWLNSIGEKCKIEDFQVGTDFSHVNDILICEKYINYEALRKLARAEQHKKKFGKVKRESRLIDNQYRLHVDTLALKKYINEIHPDDFISISEKQHGASYITSKVLCKRKLRLYERILKLCGININDQYYDIIYGSRKVVKNQYADQKSNDYYNFDIWGTMAKKLEPYLKNGMTIYGEVFGMLPTGSWIQPLYDYGTKPLEHNYIIYRITYTNTIGEVFEFTEHQIIDFCKKYNLNHPIYHYIGYARDLIRPIDWLNTKDDRDLEKWREQLLNYLIETYTEMDCPYCVNKVAREGIVLRKFAEHFNAFKLKSLRFIAKESEQNDRGEVDLETQESIDVEHEKESI